MNAVYGQNVQFSKDVASNTYNDTLF